MFGKLFNNLKNGLTKTKNVLTDKINETLKLAITIDEDLYEELEEILIMADIGMDTTVEMMVKSETGKTEKYYINIIKKSADASAEIIKVNDIIISDPYEVDIKRLDNKVKIYVKATNEKASVKIADEDEELSESTAILEISKGVDDVVIPVIITAQNGTEKKTYNIKLHRLSNNTEIKEILVNDEKVDLSTFEHIVKNVNSVDVKVTTADEKDKILQNLIMP